MLKNNDNSRLPYAIGRGGNGYKCTLIADPFNNRVKLKSFQGDLQLAVEALQQEAQSSGYGKAIAYVRKEERDRFTNAFAEEGHIPGFFDGVDAHCMTAFFQQERSVPRDQEKANEIIRIAQAKEPTVQSFKPQFSFRQAHDDDVSALARLYGTVFGDSYPTPLSDPGYVKEAMKSGSVFWLVFEGSALCGAASLETNMELRNAEVTDCAVYPDYRGQGLLADLVGQLEDIGRQMGLQCLYSLSRALLPGINIVLAAAGYRYYGRLVNNCRICGGFEDMNIWQKFITS